MIDKVLKALNDYSMLGGASEITVALSGGADSVALTNVLYSLREIFNFELSAAHFNHKIRGKEADRDEAFCRDFCRKLGIKLYVGTADVPAIARAEKESLELCARRLRYAYFASLNTDLIATAHTASDNLETVILNITRGTGLAGLCGIPAKRDRYIRPLIYCTRDEIEHYCEANGLEFVNDSTNFTDDCSRNIIRHRVVPALKEINPSVENTALNSSKLFAGDNSCLESAAKIAYKRAFSGGALSTGDFAGLDNAIVSRVLRRYYFSVFKTALDGKHLSELIALCRGTGKISLCGGAFAVCKNGLLKIEPPAVKKEFEVNFESFPNTFFDESQKVNKLLLKNILDCDKIVGELKVRTREEGDKIRLANKNGTKSFKKLYNEYKIPLAERESLPVIADDEGPVWVYKIGVAQRCAADENSRRVYVIDTKEKEI